VAEIADTHHVLDPAAIEELVTQRHPILRCGPVSIAGEEFQGLIEVPLGEVAPPDQDVRLLRGHRSSLRV